MTDQASKAAQFKALQIKGDPLVLYNIWDAGGAKTLAEAGAKASATGSWSMAAAHGFEYGEDIPLDLVVQIVQRIASACVLPLTVDFEGGYAAAPEQVAENVRRIIQAGANGFFIPGLTELSLIEKIVGAVSLPVNVMMMGDLTSISTVAGIGISRASYGPGPYFTAMSDLKERFGALS